jgi:CHAT domain-containing protein
MESAIWLSAPEGKSGQGRPWNARAMATVDMRQVDLVSLSSCETGLTDPEVERDVFGIARALFFAGAKKIVAPLWMVHDQATAELMRAFHGAYAGDVPAVFALQQAQRELMRTEKYRHPFYWSGFILIGAGK